MNRPLTPSRRLASLGGRIALAAGVATALLISTAASPPIASAASRARPAPVQPAQAYEKDIVVVRWTENRPTQADIDNFEKTYQISLDGDAGLADTWRFKILDGTDPRVKADAVRHDPHVDWAGTTDDAVPPRTTLLLPLLLGGLALVTAIVLLIAFGPSRLRSWIPGSRPSDAELERLREKSERIEQRHHQKAEREGAARNRATTPAKVTARPRAAAAGATSRPPAPAASTPASPRPAPAAPVTDTKPEP